MASVTDPDGDEHSSVTITLGFAEFEVCGAFSGSSMEASGSSSASLGADDDCFAKSFPSPVKQELLTIRDLGVLNSVSPAASALPSAYFPCILEYALSNRISVARPKSEDKRNAILDAATRVFAERGLSAAPTSEISKRAGVAEGTLFTYFETKGDLINALYRSIKLELADAMMSGFPRKKNVRTRLRHVWDRYVNWGVTNPEQRKVLAQLQVSEMLSKESIEAGGAPFVEMQNMIRDAIDQHILRVDVPIEMISEMMAAVAEASMNLIALKPAMANKFRNSGFEVYWAGIARK